MTGDGGVDSRGKTSVVRIDLAIPESGFVGRSGTVLLGGV